MRIIYSNHPVELVRESLFLVGPTPRSPDVKSWRPEALEILKSMNYSGTVYVPEWDNAVPKIDYITQVQWELDHLENCKVIVAWVPRNHTTMPALTTNVEFGSYVRSGRLFYGRPNDAVNCRYLDWLYKEVTGRTHKDTLFDLLREAIDASPEQSLIQRF